MSRDDLASLVSNDLSRPIIAGQERSFREGYVKGSVSMHRRNRELKAGLEVDYGSIHERFNYIIADPDRFDPGLLEPLTLLARDSIANRRGLPKASWTVDG